MWNPYSADNDVPGAGVPSGVRGSSASGRDLCWACRAGLAAHDGVRRFDRAAESVITGLIWRAAWAFVDAEQAVQHVPCVGTILDKLLGPAEDFEYVSQTTLSSPPL